LSELAPAREDVTEVESWVKPAEEIEIRQSDIGVDHDNSRADFSKSDRQVEHHVRCSNSPFAAREHQ
jgi:hypothetical protein